jgi:hypothetical protein
MIMVKLPELFNAACSFLVLDLESVLSEYQKPEIVFLLIQEIPTTSLKLGYKLG